LAELSGCRAGTPSGILNWKTTHYLSATFLDGSAPKRSSLSPGARPVLGQIMYYGELLNGSPYFVSDCFKDQEFL
jgi:hypothetical protein